MTNISPLSPIVIMMTSVFVFFTIAVPVGPLMQAITIVLFTSSVVTASLFVVIISFSALFTTVTVSLLRARTKRPPCAMGISGMVAR
ncbi:hypothetical protein EDB19DRAFT_1710438, partial [Suillus lakei]